jgi:hypothetical protein
VATVAIVKREAQFSRPVAMPWLDSAYALIHLRFVGFAIIFNPVEANHLTNFIFRLGYTLAHGLYLPPPHNLQFTSPNFAPMG